MATDKTQQELYEDTLFLASVEDDISKYPIDMQMISPLEVFFRYFHVSCYDNVFLEFAASITREDCFAEIYGSAVSYIKWKNGDRMLSDQEVLGNLIMAKGDEEADVTVQYLTRSTDLEVPLLFRPNRMFIDAEGHINLDLLTNGGFERLNGVEHLVFGRADVTTNREITCSYCSIVPNDSLRYIASKFLNLVCHQSVRYLTVNDKIRRIGVESFMDGDIPVFRLTNPSLIEELALVEDIALELFGYENLKRLVINENTNIEYDEGSIANLETVQIKIDNRSPTIVNFKKDLPNLLRYSGRIDEDILSKLHGARTVSCVDGEEINLRLLDVNEYPYIEYLILWNEVSKETIIEYISSNPNLKCTNMYYRGMENDYPNLIIYDQKFEQRNEKIDKKNNSLHNILESSPTEYELLIELLDNEPIF